MKTILVTGVGGGGSNNLVESIRQSHLDLDQYRIIGSNISNEIASKSTLESNFVLPVSTDESYHSKLLELIERERIDLIIPNNDREIGVISKLREKLPCKTFLPDPQTIIDCQDKHLMYLKLKDVGISMAKSFEITSLDEIGDLISQLPGSKFWIRPKVGSGSKGATWVYTAQQAKDWIRLWVDLRGFNVKDFTVSEFLPGRDYAFQSVWKDGELIVAKMCERLEYFFGANRLSGMSSTPAVARTIRDDEALETIFKAVRALTDKPHGNFNFDLKGSISGEMCLTECNVGRFCMITPIFDRTGKYNTVEMYIRAAFNEELSIEDPIDIEEDQYLLRELDTEPLIIDGDKMRNFAQVV